MKLFEARLIFLDLPEKNGRCGRVRTADLYRVRVALPQLSYAPTSTGYIYIITNRLSTARNESLLKIETFEEL